MSSRLFREALSMESNQEEVSVDSLAPELAMESATVEIQEAAREVEMNEYQQEELEHAHASLESIALSLESLMSEDERGLDRVSAEGYRHAITAIVGDALPNPVASLESFGGETECAAATQLSMEGIKDTIGKIWDAIKRAVQNAIRATGDFFSKLFGGVGAMEKRLEKMEKEVADAKKEGLKAKEGDFKVPNAERLALGGKVDSKVLEEGVKLVNDEVVNANNGLQKEAEDFYKDLSDFYKSGKGEDALNKVMEDGTKQVDSIVSKVTGKELPGGKAFEKTTTSGDAEMTVVSVPKLVDYDKARKFDGKDEISTPSLDWIASQIKALQGFTAEMKKAKDKREALKKSREEVVKAAESWVKDAEKGKLGEAWTQAKVSFALKAANKDFSSTIARADSFTFSYNRAMMAVLSAALGKYEKAEEKKEEK